MFNSKTICIVLQVTFGTVTFERVNGMTSNERIECSIDNAKIEMSLEDAHLSKSSNSSTPWR